MITRDIGQIKPVLGVDAYAYDASCGGLGGGTSTALFTAGRIIDRLALGRNYNSVQVHAGAKFDIGTSTLDTCYGAISAWLYHSSTTCAADFDRYSTDNEKARAGAFGYSGPSTTSTLAGGFMATACTTSTASATGYFSATSTGFAYADYAANYSLSGANRYLRPYAISEVYSSSSGGGVIRGVVDLLFGEPDEAPFPTTSTGAVVLA